MLAAGKPRSGIALLTHRGRVSAREYQIPIMTAPSAGGFAFALTYGTEVDWYKNLKARGWGRLRWHGADFVLSNPRQISSQEGQRLFDTFKGTILRLIKLEDYILTDGYLELDPHEGKTEYRTLAP